MNKWLCGAQMPLGLNHKTLIYARNLCLYLTTRKKLSWVVSPTKAYCLAEEKKKRNFFFCKGMFRRVKGKTPTCYLLCTSSRVFSSAEKQLFTILEEPIFTFCFSLLKIFQKQSIFSVVTFFLKSCICWLYIYMYVLAVHIYVYTMCTYVYIHTYGYINKYIYIYNIYNYIFILRVLYSNLTHILTV